MKPLLIVILTGVLCLAAAPAADAIRLEAENLADAYNAGNGAIAFATCSTASGGRAIDGLDYPGDWIELNLLVFDDACLYTHVRSGGLLGVIRSFTVEFFPQAPATTTGIDSLTTFPGAGIY